MKFKTRLAIALLTTGITFLTGMFVTRSVTVFLKYRQQPSPWQVLLRFENQDLEGLDEQSSSVVKRAMQQLTGNVESKWNAFEPRLFRTITNTAGEKRYILVEERPMRMIPDVAKVRVHIFDTAGKLLDAEEFSTGLRISLTSLNIRKVYGIPGEALVASGETVFTAHSVYQVYSVIGNQITLVQLSSGLAINHNDYQSWEIGPKIRHSIDEWEKLLMSKDNAEVMAALIWLDGDHRPVSGSEEDSGELHDVEILRSRESVRRRLAELSQAEGWIKSMAVSAAKQE